MVSVSAATAANAALKNQRESVNAVFTGATSGIGLETLKLFAQNIPKPKAIIVGRSQSKFEPELQNLQKLNPNGDYQFIEAEISLLKNIDAVAEQIKQQNVQIDLLYMSQGYLSIGARKNNADGLDNSFSLRYYGRVRLTQLLLPIMSSEARVISVLAGGQEGKLFEDDLDLEHNWSFTNALNHVPTMMSLAFDHLAEQNPQKSFIHIYPGVVNTGGLARHTEGFYGILLRIFETFVGYFLILPRDAGEIMLYAGTNPEFAKGSWTLDSDATPQTAKELAYSRERGMASKVNDHNQKIFERVLSQ